MVAQKNNSLCRDDCMKCNNRFRNDRMRYFGDVRDYRRKRALAAFIL